ncbi:restriction endonuclease subunit S, partial [Aeromonas finlandensis]|uniref:restriction endonuclease subunit S n=1 Tax=Aeromonas finlandensis TaxID=1543375 RepID=UPI00051B9292
NILPQYIAFVARSSFFKSQISQYGGGTNISNLSQQILNDIALPLPPHDEQKKIVQILSTWDKAISTTEQLLANSQQQKKALMQQLLTGKKRLLDKNGVRFSGEWESKPLSDIAEVYQPKTISQSMLTETGYPVYGANGIIGLYEEFNHATEQIAVTCRGSTCGVVNWTQAQSWITGNAMVINTDNFPAISKKFLFYVLDGSNLSYLISGSGQPQITGNIKTHVVKIPALEEQQKIAAALSTADQEITTLQQKLDALKQEKKALMQQLLTGKRRVKVEEAA